MDMWKKVNEALPEISAWLQQMYFAAFRALKIYEDLVNLLVLFSGKEGKEVKSRPYPNLAVATLRWGTAVSPRIVLTETDCSAISYQYPSEKSESRKLNGDLIFLVPAKG